jgi:prepilin-type N-terminal cleavage/methylation domain-containing protein
MKSFKNQQSGFTLVEIAIVLVIIGLLLGGILKGQELINSAKVKNLAQDFKTVPLYIYGYQDRFKALPGDDIAAFAASNAGHLPATTSPAPSVADNGDGNGVINGLWDASSGESFLFWRHVRAANFAAGSTDNTDAANYPPKNVEGGRIGITGNTLTQGPVIGMSGTYAFCSANLLGKYAKQLDTTLDDGNTATGSVRVIANGTATPQATAIATGSVDDATTYTVCMTF